LCSGNNYLFIVLKKGDKYNKKVKKKEMNRIRSKDGGQKSENSS